MLYHVVNEFNSINVSILKYKLSLNEKRSNARGTYTADIPKFKLYIYGLINALFIKGKTLWQHCLSEVFLCYNNGLGSGKNHSQ